MQAHQASSIPGGIGRKTLSNETFSLPATYVGTETKPESNEPYISAEGIDKYLSKRGLKINPSSPYVAFRLTPGVVSTPTLFDEICQRKEIKMSVRRLVYGENNPVVGQVEKQSADKDYRTAQPYGMFGGWTWDSGIRDG